MKFNTLIAAAVALSAAVPAFAGTQVVAGPGVTLTEAAQAKFNRDTGRDNRQYFAVPGQSAGDYGQLAAAAGLTADEARGLSLDEIFVAKINREAGRDEQQSATGGTVSMSSRSSVMGNAQLIAAAGLTADQAAGMSLQEIAVAKFNRDSGRDNRQGY